MKERHLGDDYVVRPDVRVDPDLEVLEVGLLVGENHTFRIARNTRCVHNGERIVDLDGAIRDRFAHRFFLHAQSIVLGPAGAIR